ncbi:UNVERIFIED_CONTAM: hypothetical protein Sangu_1451200 [Sesamum angustifolium]|uniref:Uncharacterized protein n=1 Tax=Sesamum angustifolium TaxID=2727405 RepID=A0AAW2NA47_9LAMI
MPLVRTLFFPPTTSSSIVRTTFWCSNHRAYGATSESVRFIGESVGEDLSEATSKKSGPDPPSYASAQRWSLCQATRRLLDEFSEEEEEGDDDEEGSSPGEGDTNPGGSKAPSGTRGSWPLGSD